MEQTWNQVKTFMNGIKQLFLLLREEIRLLQHLLTINDSISLPLTHIHKNAHKNSFIQFESI